MGVLSRRRWLLIVFGGLAVSVLSFHAREGLEPIPLREWSGPVELVADPQDLPGRVVVDVASDVGRLQMVVPRSLTSSIRAAPAGRRFFVRGSLREVTNPERVAYRHVRMALTVTELSEMAPHSLWRLPVDLVRGAILRGAQALPLEQQPIYSGFVIGDDRGSDGEIVAAFETSGLTHLLVVSGQNVVFIIAVLTPLVSRLRRRQRIVVHSVVLVLFAAVTRFEPSVLRATTMALVAVLGAGSGRPLDVQRRLALAVSVLIVIDPLLVESLGFRLSVAATLGISFLAVPIAKRLVGPTWLRQVLSVTIAAQVAVAPLIIPIFGPLPLASLPANVLAEPVAGFVMMWGSSVGLLAGAIGGTPAVVLQTPVRLGVWWIMAVADWCVGLPLPRLSLQMISIIFCCSMSGVWMKSLWIRQRSARQRRTSAG